MASALYTPQPGMSPTEANVRAWFANIAFELGQPFLGLDQKKAVRAYYCSAGLLRPEKSRFFLAHFARPLAVAVNHLFGASPRPRILDLGCGMGTQSLLFALLGAEVVGVDMDGDALAILRARKAFYEQECERPLDIKCFLADSFSFEYQTQGPFDGMWSLFAFNMMQPSRALLDRFLTAAAPGCRFAVMDGNRLHWGARIRRRPFSPIPALSPPEFAREMRERSFRVSAQHSGIAFPPIAWRFLPFRYLRAIEEQLDGKWRFPISHLILAEKEGGRA